MTDAARDLYLELIKRCILGLIYEDTPMIAFNTLEKEGIDHAPEQFDRRLRELGQDWPAQAHSMIGVQRMDNIRFCVEHALADGVRGDLIETGVWRGGATIFMRAILKAHGVRDRTVWVADSFEGVPKADLERYPADQELALLHGWNHLLGVPVEEVRRNFEQYGLLDDQVRFLEGWFKDTLPGAPIERLAVLRLDGDLYESTMDALVPLYPKLSPRGFCIVDDYNIAACAQAIEDYRGAHGVTEEIVPIDNSAVYWRRNA
jgi:hypothetical protein